MDILEYKGIPQLKISKEACERYTVPQARTKHGIRLAAVFSESCYKILGFDGSNDWDGIYDPNYGLFGQKAVMPDKPVVLVASELEALRLASVGLQAICVPMNKTIDPLTMSILIDQLKLVTKEIHVWEGTLFTKRHKVMESFLLAVAAEKYFKVLLIEASQGRPPLAVPDIDIQQATKAGKAHIPWRPKGVLSVSDVMDSGDFFEAVKGYTTGYDCFDKANKGLRKNEITTFTAGTGVGKSTIVREIAYHLLTVEGLRVGLIFLEESPKDTAYYLAAIKHNIPVESLQSNPKQLSSQQWRAIHDDKQLGRNATLYNHFGSLDSEELMDKIDYMVDFMGCDFICLDHISIAVSGISSKEGERKDIDILMTALASRVVSKPFGVLLVSHLSQPDGTPHEEGGRVTLSQLRGSGGIKQMSWNIYAAERNQQDGDSCRALLRKLKGRKVGDTGPAGVLYYNKDTGRLREDTVWDAKEYASLMDESRSKSGRGGKRSFAPKPQNNNSSSTPNTPTENKRIRFNADY